MVSAEVKLLLWTPEIEDTLKNTLIIGRDKMPKLKRPNKFNLCGRFESTNFL